MISKLWHRLGIYLRKGRFLVWKVQIGKLTSIGAENTMLCLVPTGLSGICMEYHSGFHLFSLGHHEHGWLLDRALNALVLGEMFRGSIEENTGLSYGGFCSHRGVPRFLVQSFWHRFRSSTYRYGYGFLGWL